MSEKNKLRSSGIGGQAVMEGVMMRNKDTYAVAVRKPDKTIDVDVQTFKPVTKGKKFLSLPFVRGVFSFVDSLVIGVKTLAYSASFFEDDEEIEPSKFEMWLLEKFGEKAEKIILGFTLCLSVILAVGLFMLLPLFIADMCEKFIPGVGSAAVPVIEGVAKVVIFIGYMLLISLMPDIKRTYMYHGAEHKCINCIETGKPLNVENVRNSSRFHRRCGTSFMFLVIIISVIMFLLVRTDIIWLRYVIRILLIPVIAGISYEFIMKAGAAEKGFFVTLSKPGLMLQKITTKEPTDDMIEVAIKSVEAVFDWKEYLRSNGVDPEPEKKIEMPKNYERVRKGSGYNWKY